MKFVSILLHVIIELGTEKSPYFMTYQVLNPTVSESQKKLLWEGFFPHLLKENSKDETKYPSDGHEYVGLFDSLN